MNVEKEIQNLKSQDQKLIERILESGRSNIRMTTLAGQNTLNRAEAKTLEAVKQMEDRSRGIEGMISKTGLTMEEGIETLSVKIDDRADEIMDRLDSLESGLGAKIDAVGSAVSSAISSLKATISDQEQTISSQAETIESQAARIAELEEQLANAGNGTEGQP